VQAGEKSRPTCSQYSVKDLATYAGTLQQLGTNLEFSRLTAAASELKINQQLL
jgi:putative component of membrane protein insertase Oxa1/YidC/SpoIIIJ protein YidD